MRAERAVHKLLEKYKFVLLDTPNICSPLIHKNFPSKCQFQGVYVFCSGRQGLRRQLHLNGQDVQKGARMRLRQLGLLYRANPIERTQRQSRR